MAEIDPALRAIFLNYHFRDRLKHHQIEAKIGHPNAHTIRDIYITASNRAGSRNINEILQFTHSRPRSGRPRRIEPDSDLSIEIRENIRGRGR